MAKERILNMRDAGKPAPITKSAITETMAAISRKRTTLQAVLSDFKLKAAKLKSEMESQIEGADPSNRRVLKDILQKDHDSKLRALRKETEESRWAAMREVQALTADLSTAKSLFSNPLRLATIHGLGGEARARYLAELQNARPATIGTYAEMALAQGDKDLAAALISKLDGMSKEERAGLKITASDLAAAVWGKEAAEMSDLLSKTDAWSAEDLAAIRETDGQKVTPVSRISHGLTHGEESRLPQTVYGGMPGADRRRDLLQSLSDALKPGEPGSKKG